MAAIRCRSQSSPTYKRSKTPPSPKHQPHNFDRSVERQQHVADKVGERQQHDHVLVGIRRLLRDHFRQSKKPGAHQGAHGAVHVTLKLLSFGELVDAAGENQPRTDRQDDVARPVRQIQQSRLKVAHHSFPSVSGLNCACSLRLAEESGGQKSG